MTEFLITRRTASIGVLLSIVSIGRAANSATSLNPLCGGVIGPFAQQTALTDLTKWGDDGTRDNLAAALDTFFGSATGPYADLSQGYPDAKVQPNGEYLLSDQLRLPLMGVAMQKMDISSGEHIYPAFISRNPLVRVFILADNENKIIAVAYADTMDVTKEGRIIGIVPRVTLFYRTAEPPKELQEAAVQQMQDYYKAYAPDTTTVGYDIHVFAKRLAAE